MEEQRTKNAHKVDHEGPASATVRVTTGRGPYQRPHGEVPVGFLTPQPDTKCFHLQYQKCKRTMETSKTIGMTSPPRWQTNTLRLRSTPTLASLSFAPTEEVPTKEKEPREG